MSLRITRQELLEWALLLAGTILTVLSSTREYFPQISLTILLLAFAVRINRTGQFLPRSGMEAPWLLFLGSAAVAAAISIFPMQALLQFNRLAAAFVLFCALVEAGYRVKRLVAWGLVLAGGVLAVYWPLTHEFASDPGKIPPLTAIGKLVNRLLPNVPGAGFSANVVGGTLAVLLPFGIALLWVSNRRGWSRQTAIAGLMSLSMLGGLLLTSSRGALLGLAAAAGLTALVWLQISRQPRSPGKAYFWLAVGAGFVLVISLLAATGTLELLLGSVHDPTGSLQSRMQIWRQSLDLIGDYVYTGAGLHSFPLVFSIYRLLIHVPYHEHMHNIFLETWYEQGVFGAAAMLWGLVVVAIWAWRGLSILADVPTQASRSMLAFGWAGMAALVIAGVHGMVDVIFYTKRTMPVLGLVIAFAYLVSRSPVSIRVNLKIDFHRFQKYAIAGATLMVLFGVLFARPLLGSAFANFGALSQTRTEMRFYNPNFYDEPSLDAIRRQQDLSNAETGFQLALRVQPTNRTAVQRLAEIALGRGDFERANELLEDAHAAGTQDEVSRLLYGDALVALGKPAQAAQIVSGTGWAGERLYFQAWYRYWLHDDFQRAADAWKAVLLLDGENSEAEYWLEQAQDAQGAQ